MRTVSNRKGQKMTPNNDMETLYQEVLADIRFSKNQQWLITTYAVGILVFLSTLFDNLLEKIITGLFNFHQMALFHRTFTFTIFAGLIIIVMILAVNCVSKYANDVRRGQEIKNELLADHLQDYKSILKPKDVIVDDITPLLQGVIIGAGIIILGYSIYTCLYCF
jgi:hypothetical protein